MTWLLIRFLTGCWSLAGAPNAISMDITNFRVGNHRCCELGGHAGLHLGGGGGKGWGTCPLLAESYKRK